MKLTGDMKRRKRYSSHDTFESADTEGRYESLKSIQRLLENDVRELVRRRAATLPVLQVGGVGVLTRRRSSVLADYMKELARVRSEVINALVPDTEETAPPGDSNRRRYSTDRATTRKPSTDSAECTKFRRDTDLQTGDTNSFYERDPLLELEESTGRTESPTVYEFANQNRFCDEGKNVRRISVHDSDFQQFLGIRYLEICNKKQNDIISVDLQSQLGLKETPEEEVPLPKIRPHTPAGNKPAKCSVLNVKLLALARSRRRSSFNKPRENIQVNRKLKLPPILIGQGGSHRARPPHDTVRDCGLSMPCSVSLQMSRRGVPCHTERRCTLRQQAGRLHALLAKFRDTSSTTQKIEQEKLLDKLDEMNT